MVPEPENKLVARGFGVFAVLSCAGLYVPGHYASFVRDCKKRGVRVSLLNDGVGVVQIHLERLNYAMRVSYSQHYFAEALGYLHLRYAYYKSVNFDVLSFSAVVAFPPHTIFLWDRE